MDTTTALRFLYTVNRHRDLRPLVPAPRAAISHSADPEIRTMIRHDSSIPMAGQRALRSAGRRVTTSPRVEKAVMLDLAEAAEVIRAKLPGDGEAE